LADQPPMRYVRHLVFPTCRTYESAMGTGAPIREIVIEG